MELGIKEHIDDRLVEWEVVDSAGFSIRPPSGSITNDQPYNSFRFACPFCLRRATNQTQIQRMTSFFNGVIEGLREYAVLAHSWNPWSTVAVGQ